ncbi:MAG: dihydrodipicolinate synthase family protein [Rhodospirillaceae bacterium]|nr:dihydrodipicolinate synthase family protein [Rhodospirillaceae bacterium]|tara:strand:+ start:26315 stop:27277 length:963 start_codon:yes stop_codon:yes gene_type:complete
MPRFKDFMPAGVIPATLLAFNEDFSINEAATRAHLSHVANVRGISAITVNGHASEVHACSDDEQQRILDVSLDEVGDRLPLINGVWADGSHEAARIAKWSEAAGASCLLVFPPQPIMLMQGQLKPEMGLAHFKTIADATDLPMIAFQYPVEHAYQMETLHRMIEEIPNLVAIKDWNMGQMHERHIRELQASPRPFNVLTTNSAWLMSSLTMGANGLLSGSGSVIADLQVALFEAVQQGDLKRAQAINDRIYPTAQCFYSPPATDMHNRMKEALVLLGRMPQAIVRPPLVNLTAEQIETVRVAIEEAGLTYEGADILQQAA